MAKITLQYDSDNPIAGKFLDFLLSLGIFKKVSSTNEKEILEKKEYLDNLKKVAPEAKKQALSNDKSKSLQSLIDEL